MFRFAVVLLVLTGCGTSPQVVTVENDPAQVDASPTVEPAVNLPRKTLSVASEDGVVSLSRFSNTGVKEDVLLSILNSNTHPDSKFHHTFELVRDDGDVRLYKDKNSPFVLALNGPKDDLILMEFMIRYTDFFVEKEIGDVQTPYGGALGRCVQRLGMAVDPSWASDLNDWTAKVMLNALVNPEGARLVHKHLVVLFTTEKLPNGVTTMNFAIGKPEEDTE